MANNYGVEVLGLDLSQNMLDIANEHKMKLFNEKVKIKKYWKLGYFAISVEGKIIC